MNLAKVIGTVWATKKYPSLEGKKLKIMQPLTFERKPIGKPIVGVDSIGCAPGELVFYITAREAVIALAENMVPVDASIVGIVDRIDHMDGASWIKGIND